MTNILLDLSGKVDGLTIEVLEVMDSYANSKKIPFFVIGATARDMILTYGYGVEIMRATLDIDFGVQLPSWEQYEILKGGLLSTGNFKKDRMPQRLIYKGERIVDIVPFGTIGKEDDTVEWPPPDDTKMSLVGFKEAYRDKQMIRVRSKPKLEIPFASLKGLVILKLISWDDNYPNRNKDAQDISVILQHYIDAGNDKRFYQDHSDILEIFGMDYTLASARLLGRDMATLSSIKTKKLLLKILNRETSPESQYRLIRAMNLNPLFGEDKFEETLKLIESLKAGIKQGV